MSRSEAFWPRGGGTRGVVVVWWRNGNVRSRHREFACRVEFRVVNGMSGMSVSSSLSIWTTARKSFKDSPN